MDTANRARRIDAAFLVEECDVPSHAGEEHRARGSSLGDAAPGTALLVALAQAIPMRLDADASKVVRMHFRAVRTDDDAHLKTRLLGFFRCARRSERHFFLDRRERSHCAVLPVAVDLNLRDEELAVEPSY